MRALRGADDGDDGEAAWFVCLRAVNEDGASRLRPGRARTWVRVARRFIRSKVKGSEGRNFGVERLLGAANGEEPKRGIHA